MTKLNRAPFSSHTVAFGCGGLYSTQRLLARLSTLRSRLRLGRVLVTRKSTLATRWIKRVFLQRHRRCGVLLDRGQQLRFEGSGRSRSGRLHRLQESQRDGIALGPRFRSRGSSLPFRASGSCCFGFCSSYDPAHPVSLPIKRRTERALNDLHKKDTRENDWKR